MAAQDDFSELADSAIIRMSDEQLLAYIAAARSAGAPGAATHGVRHLAFRHVDSVRARVQKKFPEHLVDDVTHDILVEAIASAFDGRTIKQFFAWLNTIVANQIADYWRGKKGKQLNFEKQAVALDADQDDAPHDEPAAKDDDGIVELRDIVEALLEELSDSHRQVVDLRVQGFSSKEVAERTGESVSNVDKIAQRFRDKLRARLEAAERDTGDGP